MFRTNYGLLTLERHPRNNNLLTNFDKEERPMFEEAIRQYGKADVFITDDAYDMSGRCVDWYHALRCTHDGDYSPFWRVFERVKASWGK